MTTLSAAQSGVLGNRLAVMALRVNISTRWSTEINEQSRRTGVPASVIEAVLRVERVARPWDVRIVEYLVFLARLLHGHLDCASRMTLGPAQIRVRPDSGKPRSSQLFARAVLVSACRGAVSSVAELLRGIDYSAACAEIADAVCLRYNGPASSLAYRRGMALTISRVAKAGVSYDVSGHHSVEMSKSKVRG